MALEIASQRRIIMEKSERRTERQPETKRQQNITGEQIYNMTRERAFQIYSQRGTDAGDAMTDWLEAERQIKRKLNLK